MRSLFIYRVLFIIIAVMLTVVPSSAAISGSNFVSVIDDTRKEIVSISTTGKNNGTTITVLSGKTMTVLNNMVLKSPSRIIYDIKYNGPSFTSVSKNLKSPNLKSLRVGYHSGNTRIVLDVNGTKTPRYSHRVSNHELIIFVETEQKSNDKKVKTKKVPRQNKPIASKISVLPEVNNHTNPAKDLSDQSLKEPSIIVEELEPKHIVTEKAPQLDLSVLLLKKMTEFEPNGQSEEAVLFLTGITAFKDNNFQKAGDSLKNLIKAYPKGQYSEKAYFLLAKSHDQLFATSLSKNYSVIKNSYDDAIYSYPSSVFVPDALLSAGNLCLKAKYISEAISYYNRIIKKNTDSFFTVRALLQKGQALCQKGKYTEAISIYKDIIRENNDNPGKTEAELGISKALFEMNSFYKSISLLTRLKLEPENISRYPDISLYLGYNYYQIGHYTAAIENLYNYYNIYPDSTENHLVLSKIGDAYRANKLSDSAAKIYKLVADRFPQSEGALISLTRLAEQQENGELKNGNSLISFSINDKKLSSPNHIYEKVISEYLAKDSKSPMLEYTMLKLALYYKKEKNYSKSMEVLENLLNNYPSSKLRPEIIYALSDNFEAIIKDKKNKDAYIDIIKLYNNEKHIIQRLAPPRTLLAVALACIRLGLEDTAIELLIQADIVFPDKEKPEELLYYLGKHLLENGQQKTGLKKLDLLIAQYRLGEFVAKAYHVKGMLFLDNKQYEQAIDMFSQALNSNPEVEDKIMILADMAIVFDISGLKAKSLEALKEAEYILVKNPQQDEFVYQKIGEICLHLGKPEDALLLLNNKIATQENDKENLKFMFMVAQCYEALNRKSDYISAYNQLVKSDDPLWSKLAKERMEAIIFKELLTKAELKQSRR
ncbi:MAG: tetratricopeptide repeat protein [Pseudomonadota bacterium]